MANVSILSIAEPLPFDSLLSLKGKTAIVTGGSRGIGEQVVKRFVEAGASVVFTARGKDALERVEAKLGGKAVGVQADVSSLADSQRVLDFTIEKFGGVDILVNCAAVFPGGSALDMTEEIWDETFDTDAKGAFFMAKFAAQAMIKGKRHGHIVNFLSTAALVPAAPLTAYGAAKNALWHVTRTLAQELAPYKIVINAVTPGATMTQERIDAMGQGTMVEAVLGKNAGDSFKALEEQIGGNLPDLMAKMMPLGRTGYPDDLAKAVLFLSSDMAQYISGVNITVDGAQSLQNPMMTQMPGGNSDSSDAAESGGDASAPAVAEALDQGLEGKWNVSLNSPMGKQEVLFDYKINGGADGGVLGGTVTLMGNTVEVEKGMATAGGFRHIYKMKAGLMTAEVSVTGKLENGKISGTIKSPVGGFPFEGTRM
jgi:NAD(P)-dependent dehydrogenase (short-subunit alcohol dehydrogenase family)